MIDYSHNHIRADVDALLKHVGAASNADSAQVRQDALFRAGLRLIRAEQELARMGDVITELEDCKFPLPTFMTDCICHREMAVSHQLCCGYDEGRNPDCPIHGDGSQS
jgi:hypothetical protein